MMPHAHAFARSQGKLHGQVTRVLALEVIRSSRGNRIISFPKEADLCGQLGVSRSILRESMKVLTDKGMVEMKPRAGTRSRPAEQWRLLDPDILAWHAAVGADAKFLQNLCEVRLAIEPTAAGFAAVRASDGEIAGISRILSERRLAQHGQDTRWQIELDLDFQAAVVNASHSPMLIQLADSVRAPFRVALGVIPKSSAAAQLNLEAHEALVESLIRRDSLGAKRAAEEVVGFAMLSAEAALKPVAANPGLKESIECQ